MSDAPTSQNEPLSRQAKVGIVVFIVILAMIVSSFFMSVYLMSAVGQLQAATANTSAMSASIARPPDTAAEQSLATKEAKDETAPKNKPKATPLPSAAATPPAISPPPPDIPADAIQVRTSEELAVALTGAQPGQTIVMTDGTYEGQFLINTSGTADQPITLTGSPQAIIEGDSGSVDMTEADYTVHLDTVSHWKLSGFKIHGGKKGLMTDKTTHSSFSGLELWGSKQEALHLRDDSSDNVISGVNIHDTEKDEFAEGIYIGAAESNWGKFQTSSDTDKSDRNVVENSTVAKTGGENVDIKEGTTGNIVRNNQFDGSGQVGQYPDSCVDIKGQATIVENNTCVNFIKDGFQVHVIDKGNIEPGISSGSDNHFSGNQGTVVIYDNAPGNTIEP